MKSKTEKIKAKGKAVKAKLVAKLKGAAKAELARLRNDLALSTRERKTCNASSVTMTLCDLNSTASGS